MQVWETLALEVEAHRPHIVSSTEAARAILIQLPAGERLSEHVVHERAWVVVLDGEVELEAKDGGHAAGGCGLMAEFDPGERHEVRATSDARLLLFLAPWPGEGHPGAMTLDDKAQAHERARERATG
jgi:quercetin dioxygenase-like cupin family protein